MAPVFVVNHLKKGNQMKKIATFLLAVFVLGTISSLAQAGQCDYDWQRAKDGSRCGDRAANKR
ncbi:Uncharacterised protein [Actinobacillus seminis]|uniref:Uncharacterized protein n=1 Tax=Actinobacillus seminis TaxID=722 RepID=A0A380VDA3_9PAST|nr:Uncharacterised protein [Actinobacillus seminis]